MPTLLAITVGGSCAPDEVNAVLMATDSIISRAGRVLERPGSSIGWLLLQLKEC